MNRKKVAVRENAFNLRSILKVNLKIISELK